MFKNFIKVVILTMVVWVTGHVIYTLVDGLTDENKKADIAVVLGNTVNPDGTLSTRLQKRLECSLHLFQAGRVKKILVSGGLGKEGFYEGDKMKEYLLQKGVPDSLIVVDNHGDKTLATVINTLQMQEQLGFKSLIVVSQYFHVTRTKMLFRKNNFTEVSSACPDYFEFRDVYSIIREFVAYYFG
ncbi:MAG: YdcF family protein [Cyclobacteriaceae bacterium]|nr:YdcF family protein [Flammeovirgaceae bacterium]